METLVQHVKSGIVGTLTPVIWRLLRKIRVTQRRLNLKQKEQEDAAIFPPKPSNQNSNRPRLAHIIRHQEDHG